MILQVYNRMKVLIQHLKEGCNILKKFFRIVLTLFIIVFMCSFLFNLIKVIGNADNKIGSPHAESSDAILSDSKPVTIKTGFDSITVLINREHSLPEEYKPKDLVVPNIKFAPGVTNEESLMRKDAAKALEELVKNAGSKGMNIYGVSGYRSYRTQNETYNDRVKKQGKQEADKYVAYPGQSEHETGLVMDVSNTKGATSESAKDFGETREGKWLADNAHLFGFIIRYPEGKEEITGYSYEPWHVRYVGLNAAKEIDAKRLTLEEYVK